MSETLNKAQKNFYTKTFFSLNKSDMKVANQSQPEGPTLGELVAAAKNGHIEIITTAYENYNSIVKEHRMKIFDAAKANGKSDIMNFLADKFPDLKRFLPPDIT